MEIIALVLILLILFAGTSTGGRASTRRLPKSTEQDWHVVKYRRHHPSTISPSENA
jgi:amino acid permease